MKTESVLHRAVIENDVLEAVCLLIAVTVASVQVDGAEVVIGIETRTCVASRIVVSRAAGVGVRFVGITRQSHIKAAAIAFFSVEGAVVVGGAAAGQHGRAGSGIIVAVIRILMCVAVQNLDSRAGAKFNVNAVSISPAAVSVEFALTILHDIIFRAAANHFNSRIEVVFRNA